MNDETYFDALTDLRRRLGVDSPHQEGYGLVTFKRVDGRVVQVDNVLVDSIGTDYGTNGVVSMDVLDSDAPLHMPFIESWTVDYRF